MALLLGGFSLRIHYSLCQIGSGLSNTCRDRRSYCFRHIFMSASELTGRVKYSFQTFLNRTR